MKISPALPVAAVFLWLIPSLVSATTHTINQAGLSFSPSTLSIEVGDTVEWIWSGGSHTVTSGTDLSDPEVGLLFDQSLNSGNPSVSHTFTQAGVQDYFCRPHLNFGMTGTITITAVSSVGETPSRAGVQLLPNAPNPFNPSTQITFDLPADRVGAMQVSLRVFDLKGRLVRILLEEPVAADRRTVAWDGRTGEGMAAPSGIYVYRLTAGGRTLARTMTLAK